MDNYLLIFLQFLYYLLQFFIIFTILCNLLLFVTIFYIWKKYERIVIMCVVSHFSSMCNLLDFSKIFHFFNPELKSFSKLKRAKIAAGLKLIKYYSWWLLCIVSQSLVFNFWEHNDLGNKDEMIWDCTSIAE